MFFRSALGQEALPTILDAQGMRVDVVEIDPAIIRFAARCFAFQRMARSIKRTRARSCVVRRDTAPGEDRDAA
ncbi:MAG TPA: hypothetical protein VE987_04595, partial [Polyangiaceae bacterium]|nr:hypothetical protein [Polyangiaceae bacterium]